LLRAIINPAMIASFVFGLALVFTPGLVDWSQWWPWVKAAAVLVMGWFHGWLVGQTQGICVRQQYPQWAHLPDHERSPDCPDDHHRVLGHPSLLIR
jgi:hypothetical protein